MSARARAAAVVPRLRDGRVLVGARTRHARSWPGTTAFPGGACEDADDALPLASGAPDRVRACALRELGEEVGLWLLCRRAPDGGAPHGGGAGHGEAVEELARGAPLPEVLARHGLVLDDRRLVPLLLWKTWDGRFAVQQYLLPLDEEPARGGVALEELTEVRWVSARDLRRGWREGEVFLIAPIRRVVVGLARADDEAGGAAGVDDVVREIGSEPNAHERARDDLVEGVCVIPAKSPTLPPATHTNAVLLGAGDALLVDPATPWPEEQERFDRRLQACLGNHRLHAVVCTHHHHDHVGDVARVAERFGVPVWAHKETQARVDFRVDRLLDDGEVLVCPGVPERRFRVVFTPGHAPGHVCLFEEHTRLLVAGDMVAGVGSILIDPPEGHMATYLASLERLRDLHPRALVPSHGPLLVDGTARLEEQLAHRSRRQHAVEAHVRAGGASVHEIVQAVYGADTPPGMLAFAERSVLAALEYAAERGVAREHEGRWTPV